ncbi:transketolase [Helicobacter pylori]|jgi:transketolase (EC 2.2.1.1)|uniref:Transketolase n=2 Tax=Helicobacter pylori TaxID=210 RepID=O25720_HELPY|nr:transketolase [Helicobacter pylori]AAD08131.1 transketolase A (tktA) [Helicobacter pylori 26695]AFV42301.1 transketolase [Helicobacter pylori 26695]AFV43895.1 transketolase [Helicobacter pylori Rif1]AFV45487.1 transketolase [Helicobacter pylori Rif2]AJF09320.1 transketolase [Helicobacter pylori 26695-1]
MRLSNADLERLKSMANALRFLCADMIDKANSGHPGVCLGLADVMVVLSLHLNLNPTNPKWLNRDRLVFSGGHASALAYSLLHLWGFDLSLEDLKRFRQLHSKTPGHPELHHTEGIEITTGPLGQGFANAVGFSMASQYAQNLLDKEAISHKVYCLCGDGDLQEGISYESASLAGHLRLDNLIVIYDSNQISIEGAINISFSEQVKTRFVAQNWEVLECDGHDYQAIHNALEEAKKSTKPTLLIAHTIIGKGAVGLEGSEKTHGSPLNKEVLKQSKENAQINPNESFIISPKNKMHFEEVKVRGVSLEALWEKSLSPKIKEKIHALKDFDFSAIHYPTFKKGESLATRVSNGMILNAIAKECEGFLGGSADLAPSNNTQLKHSGDFPLGQNLHFGIREHAMGAITNALAAYGLFVPFCATFFVFSDYLMPSIRLSALMKLKALFIFTHDSIGVGEDGATHQPIEQLNHLRALPNFYAFRPSDAFENTACMQIALSLNAPSGLILSRQNLPVLDEVSKERVLKGAYVKHHSKDPIITLVASGSEVSLALESAKILERENIQTQVISAPCFDLLIEQDESYLKELFKGKVLVIEASRAIEWYRFADKIIGMDSFGSSAKGDKLFEKFGFSVENITAQAKRLLNA